MNKCELCGKETNWIEMKTLELCSDCSDGTKKRPYEADLDAILERLNHYWYVKGILNDKMMSKALILLGRTQNPFLNTEISDSIKKKAEESNYTLKHDVFNFKLKNDK